MPQNEAQQAGPGTKLSLFICLPTNMSCDRITSKTAQSDRAELLDPDTTIFKAAQRRFIASASSRSLSADNSYKLWDTLYTITYRRIKPSDADGGLIPWTPAFVEQHIGSTQLPKAQVIICMQERAAPEWLKKWKLHGDTRRVAKSSNCQRVSSAYRAFCGEPLQKVKGSARRVAERTKAAAAAAAAAAALPENSDSASVALPTFGFVASKEQRQLEDFLVANKMESKVKRILQIIKIIHEGLAEKASTHPRAPVSSVLSPTGRRLLIEQQHQQLLQQEESGVLHELISEKLTNKLRQQLADPLAITSGAIPEWCHDLVTNYAPLFPFDVRWLYFTSCSFGVDRAVAGIQNAQDRSPERVRACACVCGRACAAFLCCLSFQDMLPCACIAYLALECFLIVPASMTTAMHSVRRSAFAILCFYSCVPVCSLPICNLSVIGLPV